MNTKDTEYFKGKLEKEKKILEGELATVGKSDTESALGWDATSGKNYDVADENEVADKMEELEDNEGILQKLEVQLSLVKGALDRIKSGTYGVCEKGGEAIEKERLEANPSATTCKKHMK